MCVDKCVGIDFDNKYSVDLTGNVYSHKTNKYLKPFPDGKRGYLKVKLYPKDSSKKSLTLSVHRLVKLTFDELPYDHKMDVDHVNNNILDNRYSNLDLCTKYQNIRKAIDTGSSEFRARQMSLETADRICKMIF